MQLLPKSIQYSTHIPVEAEGYYSSWKEHILFDSEEPSSYLATGRDLLSGRTVTALCGRYRAQPHVPTHDGFIYIPLLQGFVSETPKIFAYEPSSEGTPRQLHLVRPINPVTDNLCMTPAGTKEPIRLVRSVVSIDHYLDGPAWEFDVYDRMADVDAAVPIDDDHVSDLLSQPYPGGFSERRSPNIELVELPTEPLIEQASATLALPPIDRLGHVLRHMGLQSAVTQLELARSLRKEPQGRIDWRRW